MPVKQPRQGERLTLGDRLVTALLAGVLGFGSMLVVWFIVLYAGGRARNDVSLQFEWVWIVTGTLATLAFFAGPEHTMNGFEKLWALVGIILFRRTPHSDLPTRRNRRR
jgi:hypothetical protein